jgi:hypothetical protein
MSQEQLARLAANLDDVEVVHNANPWPIPGTRAEKRAERAVTLWFLISAICGLAFLAAFLFWPHEYHAPGDPGYGVYALYTPLVGGLLGLATLTLGVAVIQYVKKFFPDEVSIPPQDDPGQRRPGHRHFRPRARHRRGRPAGPQPVEGRIGRRAVALRLACRERGDGVPALRHR